MIFGVLSQAISKASVFRILPAGRFKARDGRPPQGWWSLSAERGLQMVQTAASTVIDYSIDYEHQSILAEKNGLPAPAAGWFRRLEWRPDGLYATDVRWTAKAKAMVDAGEYRFISPVFSFNSKTLEVEKLFNLALTNNPALPTLTDLASLSQEIKGTEPAHWPTLKERQAIAHMQGLTLEQLEGAMRASDSAQLSSADDVSAKDRAMLSRLFGSNVAQL